MLQVSIYIVFNYTYLSINNIFLHVTQQFGAMCIQVKPSLNFKISKFQIQNIFFVIPIGDTYLL